MTRRPRLLYGLASALLVAGVCPLVLEGQGIARPLDAQDGATQMAPSRMASGLARSSSVARGAARAPADLEIRLTGPRNIPTGAPMVYTVEIVNLGPDDAIDVQVTDQLPPGTQFVSATGSPTVTPGGLVTWPVIPLLANQATLTYTIQARAPTTTGRITNRAFVTSEDDPNAANDQASVTTNVRFPDPVDLRILKSGPSTAGSQATIRYQLVAENLGPLPAANVVVADVLPTGTRFVSATGGGVESGGVVTWPPIATLAPGVPVSYAVDVEVPVGPATITNVAEVTTTTFEQNLTNNTSALTTVVSPPPPPTSGSADLSIVKSGPTSVLVGDVTTYTIRVTNHGPDPAEDVVVTDEIPANASLQGASGSWRISGGRITWATIPVVDPGASVRFTVDLLWLSTVPPNPSPSTARVVSQVQSDPDPSNNEGTIATFVGTVGPGLVSLTKTHQAPDTYSPGDQVTFFLETVNTSQLLLPGVRLVDSLPWGVTFVRASRGASHSAGLVQWPQIDSLPPGGGPVRDTVVVEIEPSFLAFGSDWLINRARLEADTVPGTTPLSRVAVDSVLVDDDTTANTDPRIVKTHVRPDTFDVGDTVRFLVITSNGGTDAAYDVEVTDNLPSGLAVLGVSRGGTASGPVVTWPVVDSLAGFGAEILFDTVTVQILPSATQPGGRWLVNAARVVADTALGPDDNPGNNQWTDSVFVRDVTPPGADPRIAKRHVPQGPLNDGDTVLFLLTTSNGGSATAYDVTVVDTLPNPLRFVRASGAATQANGVVMWAPVDSLVALGTVLDTVWAEVPSGTAQAGPIWLQNVAWVASDTTRVPDASLANNRAVDSVLVDRGPIPLLDVALDKVALSPTAVTGGQATFEFRVTNVSGRATADTIRLTDALPPGLSFRSADPGNWTVTGTGRSVRAVYPSSLPAGALTTFRVDVDVAPTAGSILTNLAYIETQGDTVPQNDTARATISVSSPVLRLAKSVNVGEAEVGDIVSYAVRVWAENLSGASVPSVFVTDTPPLGFQYMAGSLVVDGVAAPDPSIAPNGAMTFGIGTVTNDTVLVTYRVLVGPGAALGDGINTAQARGEPDGPESNPDVARVQVRPGVFTDLGTIVGKVFLDTTRRPDSVFCPCESAPDSGAFEQVVGEVGIPGVAVYLQDGSSVITDSEGQFSFAGLSPRTWIVKVDLASLPQGTRMVPLTNRHGSDGLTVLVDVTRGELHRADFAASNRVTAVATEVRERRRAVAEAAMLDPEPAQTRVPDSRAAATGAYRALLPPGQLNDRSTSLPASPGLPEIPEGGGLRPTGVPAVETASEAVQVAALDPVRAGTIEAIEVEVRMPVGSIEPGDTLTLEATAGRWDEDDLNPATPGVQVLPAEGTRTYRLRPPAEAAHALVRASLDASRTTTVRLDVRPPVLSRIATGLLEARLDIRSLTDLELGLARSRDRFEDELRSFQVDNEDGDVAAGARAAIFLNGTFGDGNDVTFRMDSERDARARLFRDIRPDDLYSVYGDAGIRRFGAQSKGRLFGRVQRGSSFLMYGDFNTALAGYDQTGSRALGAYNRTLNGVVEHYETDRAMLAAFASRDRFSQVVDEFRGEGISGPYQLRRTDGLINSETVQLITRDRNQPAVVLRTETLQRFTDYTIEPFSGRLVFKRPISGLDSELNPVTIRVTYEVEGGGDDFWVFGANGQVRPTDRVEIGGGFVRDDNPLARFDLASVNATVDLGAGTYLMGEFARTDSASTTAGDAVRLELRHASGRFDGRLFYLDTDASFNNPSTFFGRARREFGARASASLDDRTRLFGEFIRTEDRLTDGSRRGAFLAVDRAFGEWVRGRLSYRFADESDRTATSASPPDPDDVNALGARLTARLPFAPDASLFGEFEQDVQDGDQRRAVVGGDYRILKRARLYARHELISSLTGPYGLHPDQERNSTVFGISADYLTGQTVFTEYRVRDAISGRDAHAAIGLRNAWSVRDGVRLSTSLERLSPVSSDGSTATAVTGALEFTQNPLWKGSVRGEYYARDGADNLFGSIGYARRINSDWTFLGNTVVSAMLDGDRAFERTRLGFAYRETERNRWNALGRYEHRYDRDLDPLGLETRRSAHVLSTHLNFQPDPRLILRAQWASKWASLDTDGLQTSESSHLLSARTTVDLTHRLDLGLIGRTLFSVATGSNEYGFGGELGLALAGGLRVSGGYNVFGFRDEELSENEYTDHGFYVQLGFQFDEALFGWRDSKECDCQAVDPEDLPDLVVDLVWRDVETSADSALVTYDVETRNLRPHVPVSDVRVVVDPPVGTRLLQDGAPTLRAEWPVSLGAAPESVGTVSVWVPATEGFTLRGSVSTTSFESDTTNNHDTESFHGPDRLATDLSVAIRELDRGPRIGGEPAQVEVRTEHRSGEVALDVEIRLEGGDGVRFLDNSVPEITLPLIDHLSPFGLHVDTLDVIGPDSFAITARVSSATRDSVPANDVDIAAIGFEVANVVVDIEPGYSVVEDTTETRRTNFTITTTNIAERVADSVVVRAALPAGWAVVGGRGGPRDLTQAGGVVTFPPDDLDRGETLVDTLTLVPPSGPDTVSIVAWANRVVAELDVLNNRDTAFVRVDPVACRTPPCPPDTVDGPTDVVVEFVDWPAEAEPGDTLRYTIRSVNVSDSAALGVRLTAGRPSWVPFLSGASPQLADAAELAASDSAGSIAWPVLFDLPPDGEEGSAIIHTLMLIAPDSLGEFEVTAFDTVTSRIRGSLPAEPSANQADNRDSVVTTVSLPSASVDIVVDITAGPQAVVVDSSREVTATYTIRTSNRSNRNADSVVVTAPLPDGWEFVGGPGTPRDPEAALGIITFPPMALLPGAVQEDQITLVPPYADRLDIIEARATTRPPDADPLNNQDAWPTRVSPATTSPPTPPPPPPPWDTTDVAVEFLDDWPRFANPGDTLVYHIRSSNVSDTTAYGVKLRARRPTWVPFLRGVSGLEPSGIETTTRAATDGPGTIQWLDLFDLGPQGSDGSDADHTLVLIAPDSLGPFNVVAGDTVTTELASGGPSEPSEWLGNNWDTVTTTVVEDTAFDLIVTITPAEATLRIPQIDGALAESTDTTTLVLEVTARGDSAIGVNVTLTPPRGLRLVDGLDSVDGRWVAPPIPDLAPGRTARRAFRVLPELHRRLDLIAIATSATVDSALGNNTDSAVLYTQITDTVYVEYFVDLPEYFWPPSSWPFWLWLLVPLLFLVPFVLLWWQSKPETPCPEVPSQDPDTRVLVLPIPVPYGPDPGPDDDSGDEQPKDGDTSSDRVPIVPGPVSTQPDPSDTVLPRSRNARACGTLEMWRVRDGRRLVTRGTAYLVEPDIAVTCAHVVKTRVDGVNDDYTVAKHVTEPGDDQTPSGETLIDVWFGNRPRKATVLKLDVKRDIAILKMTEPVDGIEPLELAENTPCPMAIWETYGHDWSDGRSDREGGSAPFEQMAGQGIVTSTNAEDRFGNRVMTLVAPGLADKVLAIGEACAGAPVLADGKVIGHIRRAVEHPDAESLGRSFASLVLAVPGDWIRVLLEQGHWTPATECPRHDAFMRVHPDDVAWARALQKALERTGLSVSLGTPMEDPTAALSKADQRERDRSRWEILLCSSSWPTDATAAKEADPEGAAAAVPQDGEEALVGTVVVRLDETPPPAHAKSAQAFGFSRAEPPADAALEELTALLGSDPSSADSLPSPWSILWSVVQTLDDDLEAASAGRGHEGCDAEMIRRILRRWSDAALPQTESMIRAVEALIRAGQSEAALDLLPYLKPGPARVRLEALAKADLGQTQEAVRLLEELKAQGSLDAETSEALADRYEELWVAGGRGENQYLTRCRALYRAISQSAPDAQARSRAAIDVATLSLLLGDADEARSLARSARDALSLARSDAAADQAILGEAALLLGDHDEAVAHYELAYAAWGDRAVSSSARRERHARLILDHLEMTDLQSMPRRAIEALLPHHGVVAFVGTSGTADVAVDVPEDLEPNLASALGEADVDLGICTLLGSTDLLFARSVLDRAGRLEVVLPFPAEAVRVRHFKKKEEWDDFDAVVRDERTVVREQRKALPDDAGLKDAYAACAAHIVERSRHLASRRGSRPIAMASGTEPSDADSVFARIVRAWTEAELDVVRLPGPVVPQRPSHAVQTRSMMGSDEPAEPKRRRDYRALHCLAVGIDHYDDLDELGNAGNDAEGFAFVLGGRFEFENIQILKNREATRGAIQAKLDEMQEQVQEDDLFVFFFAGHGCTLEGEHGYQDGYLAPVEAVAGDKETLIGYEELWAWGADLPARHVLYVLDACFSGMATIVTTGPAAGQRGQPGDARRTITAGGADQEVADVGFSGPDERTHSVFSSHLLWAMWRDLPEARGRKPFSAGLLYETIVEAVQESTHGLQTPSHGALPGDADGRILLKPS